MRTTKLKYDYYRVAIPGDLDNDLEKLAGYAINLARARARLWCSTCTWTAEKVYGDLGDHEVIFRVCRTRPQL